MSSLPDAGLHALLTHGPQTLAPTACAECKTAWRYMADETHRAGRALCQTCAQAFDDAGKSRSADALERDVARRQGAALLAGPRAQIDTQAALNGLTPIRAFLDMARSALSKDLVGGSLWDPRDLLDEARSACDALEARCRDAEAEHRRAAQKGGRS